MLMTTSEPNRVGAVPLPEFASVDEMEQELVRLEGLVSRVRARQVEILTEIDRLQVPYWDGTRSLKEWIAGRLDVQPRTASDLAVLTKAEPGPISAGFQAGITSTDRAAATTRLANTGADPKTLERSEGVAVSQIGHLAARQRRMKPTGHYEAFAMRRLWFQPNLANTLYTGSLTLAAADADVVLAGLDTRADQLCDKGDPNRARIEQRRVDALVSLALDATTPTAADRANQAEPESASRPAPRRLKAHIFIDADLCARTGGEAGATTGLGLKVGPNTLKEIFCIGETQTTLIDTTGLMPMPTDGDRLPNRTRDYIFYRDNGCTADGCTSMYRLEPHHIEHRSNGGDHNPGNLTLLCWFHHHVVVHQEGFTIDPHSPPGRRRFFPPGINRAPPHQ